MHKEDFNLKSLSCAEVHIPPPSCVLWGGKCLRRGNCPRFVDSPSIVCANLALTPKEAVGTSTNRIPETGARDNIQQLESAFTYSFNSSASWRLSSPWSQLLWWRSDLVWLGSSPSGNPLCLAWRKMFLLLSNCSTGRLDVSYILPWWSRRPWTSGRRLWPGWTNTSELFLVGRWVVSHGINRSWIKPLTG